MPDKVIFLDIDGVMNNASTRPDERRGLVAWLDPSNVEVLNRLVRATGAVVVVSSTWRVSMPLDELRGHFAAAGCLAEIADYTPDIDGYHRDHEIAAWLAGQPLPPRRYAILDDQHTMDALPGKLVRINQYRGLCERDVPDVLALLEDPA